jgi:hypothetical protein
VHTALAGRGRRADGPQPRRHRVLAGALLRPAEMLQPQMAELQGKLVLAVGS